MITHLKDQKCLDIDYEGANNLLIRNLFDRSSRLGSVGRVYTFQKGGQICSHQHRYNHLYFVLEGEGIISIDGVEHYVNKGSYCIIPSRTVHKVRNPGDRDFVLLGIAENSEDFKMKKWNGDEKKREADSRSI